MDWREGTRWQSRWLWSTSLSKDASAVPPQTQKCMQNTSWEWTGVSDQRKRIYRAMQNSKLSKKKLGGETGVLVGLDLPWRVEELKQASDPCLGATVWVRGGTIKAESETADLWQPQWNENQTVLATAIHILEGDHLHARLSLGRSDHGPKRGFCLCAQGRFGRVWLCATLKTVACQASLSERGFSRQELLESIGQYQLPF